mmetsp:Transcript_5003/g.12744  ORF Transcript_5003/g.12744 Transcript_5003/m.12744 type:complete len:113 (+) Transcript_5003:1524-1862(+)
METARLVQVDGLEEVKIALPLPRFLQRTYKRISDAYSFCFGKRACANSAYLSSTIEEVGVDSRGASRRAGDCPRADPRPGGSMPPTPASFSSVNVEQRTGEVGVEDALRCIN